MCFSLLNAQKSPFFIKGEDPAPENLKWKLIKNMSDEFNGNTINKKKWQVTSQRWIGRAPGLFLTNNVKQHGGSLQITASKLATPIIKNKQTFTHGGGYVGSKNGRTYGYFECEMKANKTFMSSTFWLINNRGKGTGCNKRTTELDITECVGTITNPEPWMKKFDCSMNSNTHSRNIPDDCNIEKGSNKSSAALNGKVYDDFHVYGVWWKSKDEVLFYLDGKFQAKIKPPADFNLKMHLRMVVETYNWNPVPLGGGMNGSKTDRTTTYNWVRSWKLVK